MYRKLWIVVSMVSMLVLTQPTWGDTVSALLEEGIYAEETKGDLDEAMTIYRKIIDENAGNSTNIVEAYYRLGTCYLKTGNEAKAIETFRELLNGFRGNETFASDARNQLLKLNALDEKDQKNKPLELGPVPWEAGETCWYNVNMPMSASAGKVIHSVKELSVDGNDLWRIEKYVTVPQLYWCSDVLKESLSPVSGMVKGPIVTMGSEHKAIYEKNHIKFTNTEEEKKDIPIGDVVYDNGQLWEIIRRLPLTENYSAVYNVFDLMRGQIAKVKLTVTGKETVTVPAGTFECYCIEQYSDAKIKSKIWISISKEKYIVKIKMQANIFELEKVTRVTDEKPVAFHDNEFGISMSAPGGWHFVKSSMPVPYKMALDILSPELKVVEGFIIIPYPGGPISGLWNTIMPVLKQTFQNFTPRTRSWIYGEINGLPSYSFTADYDSEDKKMVEYRTFILDKTQGLAGMFILRVEKTTFNEMKPDIDGIVQSVKWN